jgi:hypothetical protein
MGIGCQFPALGTQGPLPGRPLFRGRIETSHRYRERIRFSLSERKFPGTAFALSGEVCQCVPVDPLLQSPAVEILEYLAKCPDAQDTIDGILHWWVLDAYIQKWAPKITETVSQLVERGFLEEKPHSDGRTFYHISARYLSKLHRQSPRKHPPPANP